MMVAGDEGGGGGGKMSKSEKDQVGRRGPKLLFVFRGLSSLRLVITPKSAAAERVAALLGATQLVSCCWCVFPLGVRVTEEKREAFHFG